MTIQRSYCAVEMDDGTILGPVRTIHADNIALSRTARARKWNMDDHPVTVAFVAWHALKREGITELGYDEFMEKAIQFYPEAKEVELEVDPT
ncbi:hypothetical protein ACUIAJ_03905 [Dermabacteraceae bacterium CCM 9519]